ncbi:MAG TPA: 2OG-Fe(II) oxygenase [Polyangiaceae bacterium]|nr:2OG-Fe(II) oxygenase [Polyangiaceae bacterium]
MSVVVRFSPELGPWLREGFAAGKPEAELVSTMTAEGMNGAVARAIVKAFVTARQSGVASPKDALVLDETELEYVDEPGRLSAGTRFIAEGRAVSVLFRVERPCAAVLGGVLTAEECKHVIELARPRLAPSTVVDPATGKDVVAHYRDSFGMFFRPAENPFIAGLDARIAAIMGLPAAHGEGLQVLHYPAGAGSAPHFDFLEPSNAANRASIARSGQRVSTLVSYLNPVEGGGETAFPHLGWAVSPVPGNAVYFEYANSIGQVDRRTLHGSNRVIAGEKWVLSKWMRARPFVTARDREAGVGAESGDSQLKWEPL